MKKTLLILILTFGMCSFNVSAQTKEYKVEDDGFEWYKVEENGKVGAQDKYGNAIITTTYDDIYYLESGVFKVMRIDNGVKYGSIDKKGNLIVPIEYNDILILDTDIRIRPLITVYSDSHKYWGKYDLYGNCLIPISRGHELIVQNKQEWNDPNGVYFICSGNPQDYTIITLCDASGKTIFKSKKKYSTVHIAYDRNCSKCALIAYSSNGCFFVDQDDNVLWNPHCCTIQQFADGIKVKKTKESTFRKLTPAELNKVWLKENLTKGNAAYFASLENKLQQQNACSSSTASTSTSTNNNSSTTNNNSNSGTTTIVVEHQHTPQPVQQWQACFACGGMGTMGCDFCGGSGTRYVGDNLRRCSRCNGRGIIPCNTCFGNKGQYITVYK